MNDSFQDPKGEVLEGTLPCLPHNMAALSTYLFLKLLLLLLDFLQLQLQFLDLTNVSRRLMGKKKKKSHLETTGFAGRLPLAIFPHPQMSVFLRASMTVAGSKRVPCTPSPTFRHLLSHFHYISPELWSTVQHFIKYTWAPRQKWAELSIRTRF